MITKGLGIDEGSRRRPTGRRQEAQVHPVVGGLKRAGGEGVGSAVSVEAVTGAGGRGGGAQGTIGEGGREEVRVGRIETAGVVRDDIRGGGAQGQGGGQGGLLPAAGGFIGEGDRGEQLAGS